MAKRMFSTEIINSDVFLDMPVSTQMLYIHLGVNADDDGFVYPKRIMRMVNAGDDDLKVLISKKFILSFESGVIVLKHWKVNNYIRNDRYKPTSHRSEIERLHLDKGNVYRLDTIGIPTGGISKEVSNKESKEDLHLGELRKQVKDTLTKI